MEHRRLGSCGLQVSVMTLGAMTFGESQGFMKGVTATEEEGRRVLERALELGINCIDTADVYSEGRSEQLVGKWLGPRRREVLVASKCRFSMTPGRSRPMEQGLSRRYLIQACEDSLRRLGTEWIDLYQVHMQDGATPIEETMRALDDLVRAGKIRYAGCSNYTGYRLTEALWASDRRNLARYESVQLQWSLIERGAERELIPASRAFGLGVMAWSPLGRGLLSGKYVREQAPAPGSRLGEWKDTFAKVNTDKNWKVLEAVRGVATELGSTPAKVSLAWLLTRPECSTVIIGARTLEQLEDNLGACALKLEPKHLELLDKVSEPAWAYPYDFIGARERW
jgi:aryl-alcohol dehydrogenase-like predicted oxidoreductase